VPDWLSAEYDQAFSQDKFAELRIVITSHASLYAIGNRRTPVDAVIMEQQA
jgi:hypothetical protein